MIVELHLGDNGYEIAKTKGYIYNEKVEMSEEEIKELEEVTRRFKKIQEKVRNKINKKLQEDYKERYKDRK